jgi:Zn-dependent alcohol dehydrogenase
VLVEITATGFATPICTPATAISRCLIRPFMVTKAGVVVAVGNAVEHLAAGDHVVISFPGAASASIAGDRWSIANAAAS